MKNKSHYISRIFLFFTACILVSIWALSKGAYPLSIPKIWSLLGIDFYGVSTTVSQIDHEVFFKIRLPRVLMALNVGAALAISGSCLQGIFRNPLASPSLIGVTSGASLMAALTIVFASSFAQYIPLSLQYSFLSLMAFIGAILTMLFVYKMSMQRGQTNIGIMILSGVAISAIAGAITGLLTYLSTEDQLRDITFWNLGSVSGANWTKVFIHYGISIPCYFLLFSKGKAINLLTLGEQDAKHLGIEVEKIKKTIILCTSILVGVSVAFTGNIGFVGLIVPYILRLIFKSNYQWVIPLSIFGGGVLLVLADTLSRTIVAPSEIPIGILTAFLGAPVFIILLLQSKKNL